jgi:hypothetical protein
VHPNHFARHFEHRQVQLTLLLARWGWWERQALGATLAWSNAPMHARLFGCQPPIPPLRPDPDSATSSVRLAPSVVLIIPLEQAPTAFFTAGSNVFATPVSQDRLDRLSQFLWEYLEKDLKNLPRRIDDGPYPNSSFYASSGTYSLRNTCNTWTAEALRVAGLPVSPVGVVFAHQVVGQVRGLALQEQ